MGNTGRAPALTQTKAAQPGLALAPSANSYPEASAPRNTHNHTGAGGGTGSSATPASGCACKSILLPQSDGAAGLCAALMRSEHLGSNFGLSILRVISHADIPAPDFHIKSTF